ncbi:MAG: AAA family ATPase [Planctomycetaceae bacterium]|nr:AAA family ATPase [Planctomycetaceae bacterium]
MKNAGRIRFVQVQPKPAGVTSIGGKNRQGKTSNLDFLCWAIGGDRYKPREPNRRGGDGSAELDVTFDNGIHIQRKGKNGTLKVTDEKNGATGNQTLLDKFITTFALDIREFRSAKPKEKLDILLKTLGVDVQYAACKARIDEAYEARTVVNRIAKQKEGAFRQAPQPPELPCDERIDVSLLNAELEQANAANDRRRTIIHKKEVLAKSIEKGEAEIARLEKMLADLRGALDLDKAELAAAPLMPPEISTERIHRDIATAHALNEEYAKTKASRDNYERMAAEVRAAQKSAADAEAAVDQARKAKLDLLASCTMPDPDISVSDEGELIYKGDTWDQLADSDELILCCKIVSRLNPECRFVLVDGLEKLDDDTLAGLDAWATGAGLQIIGTRVTTDASKATLIIEDGEVVFVTEELQAA